MVVTKEFNKFLFRPALGATFLILIPFSIMLGTGEFPWSVGDFVIAWLLFFGTGFCYKLLIGNKNNKLYKAASAIAVGSALALIWINLAVGIIGSEDNPANALFFAVILILVFSSLAARFRPKGMALALLIVALAQASIPIIAFIIYRPPVDSFNEIMGVLSVLLLNGFFVALWLTSSFLFRRSIPEA